MWYLYVLKCADQTLYAGITTDVERRTNEHNISPLGAKFTRARRPVEMIYSETHANRSEATKAEIAFKKLPRSKKIEFLQKNSAENLKIL